MADCEFSLVHYLEVERKCDDIIMTVVSWFFFNSWCVWSTPRWS